MDAKRYNFFDNSIQTTPTIPIPTNKNRTFKKLNFFWLIPIGGL